MSLGTNRGKGGTPLGIQSRNYSFLKVPHFRFPDAAFSFG
jgi:hypothetical protein